MTIKAVLPSLLLVLCTTASSLHAQVTFTDTFSDPSFGPGWQTHLAPGGTAERDFTISDGLAFVSPTGSTGDSYKIFSGISLDSPWSVSADMIGQNSNRWGGIVFNVDPVAGTFYSFIVRVAGNSVSAAQLRRYDSWGTSTVLTSDTTTGGAVPLSQELTLGEAFRYTVSSQDPGTFLMSIEALDQETGAVTGSVWSRTVSDSTHSGSFSGLHVNANQVAFDSFEVTAIPEPATVGFILSGAVLLLAFVRRRYRR